MGEIILFPKTNKNKHHPVSDFWDRFKETLRNYYPEQDVQLTVAAILDKDCYDRAKPSIQDIANIYFRNAPR